MKESVNYATHTHAARAFALLVLLMARQGRESGRIVPSRLVTSRCDPTVRHRHRAAPLPWSLLRSCLPRACLGPGSLEICAAAGLEVGLPPLSLVSLLTAIRNTTIITINNITHPHPSRPPRTQPTLDRRSIPTGYIYEANAANLPCILSSISHCLSSLCRSSRRLLASITANHASCTPLLGGIPGSACLLHAARRHLRYFACITSFPYALLQIGPACSISPNLSTRI